MLSRIVTALLLALAAQPGLAKDTVTLRVGEQNYFNIQASMEASGVLKDLREQNAYKTGVWLRGVFLRLTAPARRIRALLRRGG